MSTRDPPYMSPLVKHLCKIRNKNITKGVNSDLQKRIDELIRENLVCAVNDENRKNTSGSKKWWDTVNKITVRKTKNSNISLCSHQSTCYQFVLSICKYRCEFHIPPAYINSCWHSSSYR